MAARRDQIREVGRRRLGTRSDRALARALDVDPTWLCQVLRGHRQPSAQTIALFVVNLGAPFEDLFEIREQPEPAQAA